MDLCDHDEAPDAAPPTAGLKAKALSFQGHGPLPSLVYDNNPDLAEDDRDGLLDGRYRDPKTRLRYALDEMEGYSALLAEALASVKEDEGYLRRKVARISRLRSEIRRLGRANSGKQEQEAMEQLGAEVEELADSLSRADSRLASLRMRIRVVEHYLATLQRSDRPGS